jgi:hypothetical protein
VRRAHRFLESIFAGSESLMPVEDSLSVHGSSPEPFRTQAALIDVDHGTQNGLERRDHEDQNDREGGGMKLNHNERTTERYGWRHHVLTTSSTWFSSG